MFHAILIFLHASLYHPIPKQKLHQQGAGTKIYDYAIEYELFDKFAQEIGWDDKETFNDKWPYLVPDDLTHQYMIDSKKRAYRKHYLRLQWAFSRLNHWIVSSDRFKADLKLIKMAPQALITGRTKTANA